MKALALYHAMQALWPAWQGEAQGFAAAWQSEIERIPEGAGLSALKAHARESKWPPSLAEFLLAVRRVMGESPRTQSEAGYPCRWCGQVSRGWTRYVKHEAACKKRPPELSPVLP